MADWRSELELLLAHLNVSLDRGPTPPSDQSPELAAIYARARERAQAAPPWDSGSFAYEDVASAEDEEVSAVRSEIEATVARVIELVHAGVMEPVLRDDVIFVLHALTRPQPLPALPPLPGEGGDSSQTEWQLASAAAVLRFCRIVLRLTRALDPEHER